MAHSEQTNEVTLLLTVALGLTSLLVVLSRFLKPKGNSALPRIRPSTFPSKLAWENFVLVYSVVWISCFGVILAWKLYESFDETMYMCVCLGLALPLFLYPIVLNNSFAFKANIWIFSFSCIGNYWFTHYFYNVLKADYTFPSWRLNDVPFCLFFATHFYFCLYHTISTKTIRWVAWYFKPSSFRFLFSTLVVAAMAYFSALAEAVTIASFPYYTFRSGRFEALVLGSFFYGLYFCVSYPMFYRIDEGVELLDTTHATQTRSAQENAWPRSRVFLDSLASGMLVLFLLDFARLYLDIEFVMKGLS